MTYSNEEFDNTVNPMGHCWECNQPEHVKINCPDLGQSRTSYRGGLDKDVFCYNCNKHGHYSRNCLLPNRPRKDQKSGLTRETANKIAKEWIVCY